LASHLSPLGRHRHPNCTPESLDLLCLRSAAVYATTALYEYHAIFSQQSHQNQQNIQAVVDESLWEAVFPSLDSHFLRLVPSHLYEEFLDHVLSSLEVASHYDSTGRGLLQYVVLFFPRQMKRFKVKRCYKDRVLLPTVCCLHRCVNLEELYLESADSATISTYLLSHILKYTSGLRVVSLPKQADDDVLSVVGMNCRQLETIVLTSTSVSNLGLSWLLCCRKLHTVIMKGYLQGVTSKGVALLLNGLSSLKHLVYDVLSDVLTYLDFNSYDTQTFQLRTVLFHSMELLGQNHLELVTKMCPHIEWLSLDSALTYSLEGLARFPHLRFLKLNYKGRPADVSVSDFFRLNPQLKSLHLVDVKDLTAADLKSTLGACPALETLVLEDCSLTAGFGSKPGMHETGLEVEHLQLVGLHVGTKEEFWNFLSLFKSIKYLDVDICPLDEQGIRLLLQTFSPNLITFRCPLWTNITHAQVKSVVAKKRNAVGSCEQQTEFQITKQTISFSDELILSERRSTKTAQLLLDYVGISPILPHSAWT